MLQTLQDNNDEWEAQIQERRLSLVNEDIEAAQKQIASLQRQKKELAKTCLDLEFRLDELHSNLELLQTSNQDNDDEAEDNDENVEGTFFTLLSELESEEAALKGEIQSYKDLQKSLGHDKAMLSNTNKRIQKELDLEKKKLDTAQDKLTVSKNVLNQLQLEYDAKSTEIENLIQSCAYLQKEELALSEELAQRSDNVVNELKQIERERKAEYNEELKREERLKKDLNVTQRKMQNQVDNLSKKLMKEQSVSSWRNDRSIITNKLRKAKQQILIEQQSFSTAKKRKENLEKEIKRLLGDEDPGDGTGMRAKQLVRAEINSLDPQPQIEGDDEKLIEYDYNRELQDELELIDASLEVFRNHREETLRALQNEYEECTQQGYLKLLRSEMNELQAIVSMPK